MCPLPTVNISFDNDFQEISIEGNDHLSYELHIQI